MSENESGQSKGDERLLVLKSDPRIANGLVAPRSGTGVIALVIGACVAIALVLLVLSALAVERWIDRHRNAMQDVSATQAEEAPAPTRSIPPPDPMKANATLRGNPGAAFSADNYPFEALRRREQGRTVARLSIDASGTPVRCAVETSSGSSSLDETTCQIALRSVRFDPARDSAGVPKASEYKLPVRWQIPQ
ncbi:energy transducer TonB [Sphingomonas sp. SUN019]|uniref:energy transducer TonB n=1 Tax=Sphingomonas sp. SUN019 TaxID=2937788 RepID=UPI002164B15C|nr:energy transducer TonB [Sphingomonas sp. SUN019]UVO49558.1 energy transducer TonB [Sphingomonas sp. SUN019]